MSMRNAFGELALDDTVVALKTVSDNILVAVEGLSTVVSLLESKTIKVDTDHVVVENMPATQEVSLTATSLAALETVAVSNFPVTQTIAGEVTVANIGAQGLTDAQLRSADVKVTLDGEGVAISNQLSQPITDSQLRSSDVKVTLDGEQVAVTGALTDTQLRAAAVPISVSSLPIPEGAALESTLLALKSAVDSLSAKVVLSDTGNVTLANPGLTDSELRASAIPVSLNSTSMASTDLQLEILSMLRLIKTVLLRLPFYDPTQNRAKMTTVIEANQTVATLTTCGTLTNMTNVGSYAWDTMVRMQNRSSWANTCGNKVS